MIRKQCGQLFFHGRLQKFLKESIREFRECLIRRSEDRKRIIPLKKSGESNCIERTLPPRKRQKRVRKSGLMRRILPSAQTASESLSLR